MTRSARASRASLRSSLLVFAALAALAGAAAAAPVALDYHATVEGCVAADRFGDEVSAKLGFVPWDPEAPDAIRVRIQRDGDDFVGTIEQPDGTSKVLRAATCVALDEALASAVAVALDRPSAPSPGTSAPGPGPDDRRLRRLEGPPRGPRTLHIRATGVASLDVFRTIGFANDHRGYSVQSFEAVCRTPCTTAIPEGVYQLRLSDPRVRNGFVEQEVTVRTDATLEIAYISNEAARATARRRVRWGVALGAVAGAVLTVVLSGATDSYADVASSLLGGALPGAFLGGALGYVARPGNTADTAQIKIRPGA